MSVTTNEEKLKNAESLIAQGQVKEGIEIYAALIMEAPGFLPAYLNLVNTILAGPNHKAWDIPNAERILNLAIKRFPNDPNVRDYVKLIKVRFAQHKYVEDANKKWPQFKDKHKGERCVIVGNGPSLNKMDLSFLKNETVFGLNRIYLGFERFDFMPQYLVSVNQFVLKQSAEEMKALPCWKFLSMEGVPPVTPDDKTLIINPRHYRDIFSTDPRLGICIGSTVTYCAMQIAFYMGFDTCILIGVDHSFQTKGDPHKLIESEGDDPNHFDPSYFGKGYKWQLPDLEGSERMFRIADAYYRGFRNKIIDATYEGKCDIFEKADYRDIFFTDKEANPPA